MSWCGRLMRLLGLVGGPTGWLAVGASGAGAVPIPPTSAPTSMAATAATKTTASTNTARPLSNPARRAMRPAT
jgi:hypothetical protein